MANEIKFFHVSGIDELEKNLSAGLISESDIVFIQGSKQIWTHGEYYGGEATSQKEGGIIDLSERDIYGNTISQSTSNCYVVSRPGRYKFPLVYGNAIKNGQPNSVAYTNNGGEHSMDFVNHLGNQITDPYIYNNDGCVPVSAETIVSDTPNAIVGLVCTGKEVYFSVLGIPDEGGNVVISVLDKDGVILWSWHIWLWKDSLETEIITNSSGINYEILPVNLASKWDPGKTTIKNWFYQGGRHTPFICGETYSSLTDHINYGTRELVYETSTVETTYSDGIKNPTVFYWQNEGAEFYSTWFGTKFYYNLWDAGCTELGRSDNPVIKTIYDPCPVGFCIPNGNCFSGFLKSEESMDPNIIGIESESGSIGWLFKRNEEDEIGIYIQMTGNRKVSLRNGEGKINHGYSYFWLSSVDNGDGEDFQNSLNFLITLGSLVFSESDHNSGFSVRPMKEI